MRSQYILISESKWWAYCPGLKVGPGRNLRWRKHSGPLSGLIERPKLDVELESNVMLQKLVRRCSSSEEIAMKTHLSVSLPTKPILPWSRLIPGSKLAVEHI